MDNSRTTTNVLLTIIVIILLLPFIVPQLGDLFGSIALFFKAITGR